MTNDELLKAWDNEETITSCEMGGLGDGYELVIHQIAMEMLRVAIKNPIEDYDTISSEDHKQWWTDIENDLRVKEVTENSGCSGAQFYAAKNLVAVYARKGYEEAVKTIPKDRLIKVSINGLL